MACRLAIAISGAVSLGSYEAGVMFEIVRAIGSHNRNVTDPDKQIKIDVLTGASAGGMTATILAQKLMFHGAALDIPDKNHLFMPWVKVADVKGMLQEAEGDDPEMSILSSGLIRGIADDYLLGRYSGKEPPLPAVPHPAAAGEIRLGLPLSNLNGVDYGIEAFDGAELATPGSRFIYTRFQDCLTKTVTAADDNGDFWRPLAIAACACGAFPFAFRPLHVKRDRTEVDYLRALQGVPFPESAFTYTDGGVFNNSPLGMAKSLADQVDTGPLDYERRFFLYISPDRKGSTSNVAICEKNASMVATAQALLSCIFQQGRFQDWVMTAEYNEIIEEFDDRAYRLRELMRTIADSERDAMAQVADRLLDHIYFKRHGHGPGRAADFARLKTQFMVDHAAQTLLDEKGTESVDAWIKAVQVLEQSGRLAKKDVMRVYTITASDDELAGEGIAAFAGFFDRRFREFDYAVGRKKAQQFLRNLKAAAAKGDHLPLTDFDLPDDIPQVNQALSKATLGDVDRGVRKALKERFSDRINRMLKQFKLSVWIRKPLMWFYVNGKLEKLLELK